MGGPGKVNLVQARKNLQAAWDKIDDPSVVAPAELLAKIQKVFTASDVTYKYILVTGLLGKLTQPGVHPRALQAQSKLAGAYDARGLCHKVVVSFEKTKGNLFGLSNEPFLNKPARHAEHSKDNPQLRNKRLAGITHDVPEAALGAKPAEVEGMLVSALRAGKELAESEVTTAIDVDVNLRHVLLFIQKFLRESEGGARVVAVTAAFVLLLSEKYGVKVYPPNFSDKFAKTCGDIEVFVEKGLIAAYECKHRPLTLDDVHHGLGKAREHGAAEYCFVIAAGIAEGEEDLVRAEVRNARAEQDVSLIDIHAAARMWPVLLNRVRRAEFSTTIVTILRDMMNRAEVANAAATLWNSIE